MPQPELFAPWLRFDLGRPHRLLGWPLIGPSFGMAQTLLWLQVRDADLPPEIAPAPYFQRRAEQAGLSFDAALMTAAEVANFGYSAGAGDVAALATAGLTNGESVVPGSGTAFAGWHPGTVNIAVQIAQPLTQGAMIEALSLVAEARTAAILAQGLSLADGRPLTGTGTDCILLACPPGTEEQAYCGLHTRVGRLVAEHTYSALSLALAKTSSISSQSVFMTASS